MSTSSKSQMKKMNLKSTEIFESVTWVPSLNRTISTQLKRYKNVKCLKDILRILGLDYFKIRTVKMFENLNVVDLKKTYEFTKFLTWKVKLKEFNLTD